MYRVKYYQDKQGHQPFHEWRSRLKSAISVRFPKSITLSTAPKREILAIINLNAKAYGKCAFIMGLDSVSITPYRMAK